MGQTHLAMAMGLGIEDPGAPPSTRALTYLEFGDRATSFNSDLRIDFLRAGRVNVAVPEPTAALGLSLLGLAMLPWRARRVY